MRFHPPKSTCSACCFFLLAVAIAHLSAFAADNASTGVSAQDIRAIVESNFPQLEKLYTSLHRNPELSLGEVKTSARLAEEFRSAGYTVTEHVGGHGVVAVLENGPGPVLMIRTDLDALPVKEQTGCEYASAVT